MASQQRGGGLNGNTVERAFPGATDTTAHARSGGNQRISRRARDLEVKACLWFRKTWAGKDGRLRRAAGYALAVYIPQRDERHLYLEHDLDAAFTHLSGFGYDPEEKCWRLSTYGEVGSRLVSKDADVLWNRDDFSRDLIDLAQ